MDSWSYGRNVYLANGTVLPSDSFAQNRKPMAGFDYILGNELENDDVLMSEFAEKSFVDMAGKSNGVNAISISKVASSPSRVVPPSLLPPEEEENQCSSSKFSNVASQDLTRIDFKLRSFLDYKNDGTSALPAKKPRASNTSLEKPLCQVYGCNMDLSFSKDYHKRHRVCEAHSKTSVVIVSGIEQRFCQQCSRFHFLSEFDDGKRSCRRRLAGHNERRRKPSFYFLPGKRDKLLRTSQGAVGNKFLENSSDTDFSLVLPESFPGSLLYRVIDEHEHRASSGLVSFKEEPTCTMFPAIGQNSSMIYESKYSPEASGVSSIWDLHEAAPPRTTCALSLLSAQSQQHFSEIPNTAFSISEPNQNLNHSPYHQMEPLWMDPRKTKSISSSSNGKGSSTVDLLQLSSHLQRIEQQRNFTDEVKQEHNELYFPSS